MKKEKAMMRSLTRVGRVKECDELGRGAYGLLHHQGICEDARGTKNKMLRRKKRTGEQRMTRGSEKRRLVRVRKLLDIQGRIDLLNASGKKGYFGGPNRPKEKKGCRPEKGPGTIDSEVISRRPRLGRGRNQMSRRQL